MEKVSMQLREDVSRAKDIHGRKFQAFTRNFYIMKSAVRYFSVKQGLSFTSSKVADNFPIPVSVAGSCLNVMEDLGIVESRNSSKKRYMPQYSDLERMEKVGDVLRDSFEIQGFQGSED